MIKTAQLGHHGHAKTPDGAAIATRLAVIEASQLLASHDAHGNKTPGYPADLQPRDRCRTTSINWIQKTAAALDPDSLGQTTRADSGAPIVGPDLIVESGNGRIIAIADVYDAMTSDRPYRKAIIPSEVIEYIMGASHTLFDPDLVNVFIRKIAPYPIGTCVDLSNRLTGIIIENYENFSMRPRVRIFKKDGEDITPFELDLSDRNFLNITVTSVL